MKVSKTASCIIPTVIRQSINFLDGSFYKIHSFSSGHQVPIYNVSTYHGLNQLIGYVKFINSDYGAVFYRGECKLHDTLLPSIYHAISSQSARDNANTCLNKIISNAITDDRFSNFIKVDCSKRESKLVVESTLQHYGVPTHCVDVVDNHWIALWFGLNQAIKRKSINTYIQYIRRKIDVLDIALDPAKLNTNPETAYQYMILIASDYHQNVNQGVSITDDMITIDLRTALPSTFLRPHAQHGWVIRKVTHKPDDNYDLSKNVVAIVRLRIDHVNEWLGSGDLLSVNNLFPAPAFDQGYDVLLERSDLFPHSLYSIAKYIY